MSYSFFWMIFKGRLLVHATYEDGTECCEASAHKNQTPGNHPKKRLQHS